MVGTMLIITADLMD